MEFYGPMTGAINADLDKKLAEELADDKDKDRDKDKKDAKKKRPWHRKLNRAVDRVLTHPIVEAGKAAMRFVPGVGIFVIGVDRLTRWKLTYSGNEGLVTMLEKKMTDITVTYISVIELLPPEERRESNPRLQIFAKKADQIKKLVGFIQRNIDEFNKKSEKERLAAAEIINSSFKSLQSVLEELQREIMLHLNIQNTSSLRAHGQKLDNLVKVLVAQRSVLEGQAERNEKLLSLMSRQIDANRHIEDFLKQIKDDMTPGYAKVDNLEIRKVWYDFFRWPAAQPVKDFLDQMPQYFKMQRDSVALQMWTNMQRGILLRVDDLGLEPDGLVTPYDLNEVFPFDPVYQISVGDWLVWKGLGWLFFAAEIERKLLPFRNKFTLCASVVGKFVGFVSDTLRSLRSEHRYDTTMHARLLDISVRIVSSALPDFSERFTGFIEALSDSEEVIEGAYTDAGNAWLDQASVSALVQSLSTMQWRIAACAEDLGVTAEIWDADELQTLAQEEEGLTQWALMLGEHYATTRWNQWNGTTALISPHALSNAEKLGPRTLKMVYQHQPVVLRPVAAAKGAADPTGPVAEVAQCQSYNVCRSILATHGFTMFSGCWMAIVEYCDMGDMRTFVAKHASHLTLSAKLRLVLAVANAVRYLHQRGVTHRRLTSAHVYLADGLTAKVGGVLPGSTQDVDVLRYRAPETFGVHAEEVEEALDWYSADVYALGHLLLELLTGLAPHEQIHDPAVMEHAVRAFNAERVMELAGLTASSVPSDLVHLVATTLSADPVERPTLSTFFETLEAVYARSKQSLPTGAEVLFSANGLPPPYPGTDTAGRGLLTNAASNGKSEGDVAGPQVQLKELRRRAGVPNEDLNEIERELSALAPTLPRAYIALGDLYYFDHSARGIPHDFARALAYYQQAVDAGDPLGAIGIGDCHYFGHARLPKAPGVARDLYTRALQALEAEGDSAPPAMRARAHAGMGDVLYDAGDHAQALEHYYKATALDSGCKRAWARIGDAHLYGRGVGVDPEQARKCYRKAKGTRREVEGMLEYHRLRGAVAFMAMYLNDDLLMYPDH